MGQFLNMTCIALVCPLAVFAFAFVVIVLDHLSGTRHR